MQMRIGVRGLREIQAEFSEIDKTQVPFATARMLTMTAQQGQGVVRGELPTRFTIRRLAWMKGNVRIKAATKTTLEAVVMDTFDAMERQETGADKTATHGGYVAVPLSGARPRPRALVDDSDRPARVMAEGGFIRGDIMYRVTFKAGRRRQLSRAIAGITQAATWSRKIVPMYALVRRARMQKRYEFVPTVEKIVDRNARRNFEEAFEKARSTKL